MRALSVLLLAVPALAGAQGLLIPRCPPRLDNPRIVCDPSSQVVRTSSEVRVELRDRVLRYEVEERFLNRGGLIGEADYVFPLPKGAAFRDLKLSIDGELVAGETMSAAEARRIYEEIVRRQKDPALVEWMGHGMLRTRIFPIQPGEERRVVVRFESVAEREGDAVRVDYFRGSNPGEQGMNPDRPRTRGDARANTAFTLTYRSGGELGEAYSPTHELDVNRDDVLRRVRIRGGGPEITVLVALRRSLNASVSVLANANRGEPGYALITVTPPAEMSRTRTPRDITLVIDVSGSMSGGKLDQAKAAGRQLLRTLDDQDRFRIIDFSTDVRSFRDDFVFASRENVRAAERYLDDLDASGSTNISGALEEALQPTANGIGRRDSQRLPLVLFMTDGAPTVGLRDPGEIAARAARLRGEARVFTFGIGADLSVGLVEQLALQGRGTAHFIRGDESVERAVELVASRLREPLLTDVRVTTEGGVRLSRMYPNEATDIFAGQDLVLLARYDGNGSTNVIVRGRAAGGREVRWSTSRSFPAHERENAFVPRLWATQRIGWLSAEKRRNGGSSEIDAEIRELGERFGIPTEFTSYLVLEPGMGDVAGGRRDRRELLGSAATTGAGIRGAAPAAPPAAEAFEAARAASVQRAAKSIAAADMAVANQASGEMKRAGTKLFQRQGDRWVDATLKSGVKVYKVEAFSSSYFELIQKIAGLREWLAVGDRVVVAGQDVAIEVVPDAQQLSETEMRDIVSKW